MATPTTTLTPAPDKVKDKLKHTRCCTPAWLHGLCGNGQPCTKTVIRPPGAGDCVVCVEMWRTHQMECPMDTPGWNT